MKYELKGHNIDNLLKTLYFKKIELFDIVRIDRQTVSFSVADKQAKKVNRYIKNFKVVRTNSKIKQLPKYLLVNVGVILGLFVGCLFFLFASNFTWQIQIYGLKDLTKQQIISVLNNNGIRTGKINLISNEDIETILLNNYDRIAQVSVKKEGTAIIINLSEKLVYEQLTYSPIKAKYNGIIKKINIITGTPNVRVGDYVNAGDDLVLPFNVRPDGEKISVNPLAEIEAEIYITAKAELHKNEQVLVRTGKSITEYHYKLFNKNLFCGKNKNSFALFEMVMYNESVSKLVPFSRDCYVYFELAPQTVLHNLSEEQENVKIQSQANAKSNLPQGEIQNEQTYTYFTEDKLLAITKITLLGIIND